MNKHLQSIIKNFKNIGKQIYFFHKELSPAKRWGLFAVYAVLLLSPHFIFKEKIIPIDAKEYQRAIELKTVSELSNKSTSFPFLGTVTSVNEAIIRGETSGKLVAVYKSLGDKVTAGDTIGANTK